MLGAEGQRHPRRGRQPLALFAIGSVYIQCQWSPVPVLPGGSVYSLDHRHGPTH